MPREASKRVANQSWQSATPPKKVIVGGKDVSSDSSSPNQKCIIIKPKVHIDDLPDEMLCHILSILALAEQLKIATVSRRWRKAVDVCLARCRNFSVRFIPGLYRCTDLMLEKILSRLPGLRHLDGVYARNEKLNIDIISCDNLTEFGLMGLKCLKELRTLNLFRTDVTDSVLEALEGAPHLTELTIGPDWYHELLVSEERLARLLMSCPSLKKMVLRYGMPCNAESECIDLEDLVDHLTGQLSSDRDVTLVVSARLFSDLQTEPPEEGPLRVSVIPKDEEDYP